MEDASGVSVGVSAVRRASSVVVLACLAVALTVTPAAAHGLVGRHDLPLPVWQVAWAAVCVVGASFAAVGMLWHRPRLRAAAAGRPVLIPGVRRPGGSGGSGIVGKFVVPVLARVLVVSARVSGLIALAVLVFAGLAGDARPLVNITPAAVYIAFWVGMPVLSVLIGDVWRAFNPMPVLASAIDRLAIGVRGGSGVGGSGVGEADTGGSGVGEAGAGEVGAAGEAGPGPLAVPIGVEPVSDHHWWAVATLAAFVWLELAYVDSSSPRAVAVFLVAYTAVMLSGAAVRGRHWVGRSDGFGVLFSCLSAMGPLARGDEGGLKLRWPMAGLSSLPVFPGISVMVLVVLGSTSFDGFTRSSIWQSVVFGRSGWELAAYNTMGLVFVVGVAFVIYRAAIAVMAAGTGQREGELADLFAPSLLPICVAYIVAHYFSYLIFQGQSLLAQVSDPFGWGWDLFGTAAWQIDYTLMSPTAVAWVQTGAIVVGHILAVVVAHDRALECYSRDRALLSQYPMLVAMISYTFIGLMLMLG